MQKGREARLQAELEAQQAADRAARRRQRKKPQEPSLPEPASVTLSVHIDESERERAPYHQRLMLAARAGDYQAAQAVLDEMAEAGLQPGPRAIHALIFAHVKAGDPDGAVEVLRIAVEAAGVRPLAESYAAVVHACLEAGDATGAEEALARAQRDGASPRPAWLVLCNGYFEAGWTREALEEAGRGVQQGWVPDAALYEHLIRCASQNAWAGQASEMLLDMQTNFIAPEVEHVNPVIAACAADASEVALPQERAHDVMVQLERGGFNNSSAPNTDTYNYAIQGMVQGGNFRRDLEGVVAPDVVGGRMFQAGILPDKRTYALMLDYRLTVTPVLDYQTVMGELQQLVGPGLPAGALWLLSDAALVALTERLSLAVLSEDSGSGLAHFLQTGAGGCERPWRAADLVWLLQMLDADGRMLPPGARAPRKSGRTLVTSWLHLVYLQLRAAASPPLKGLVAQSEEAGEVAEVEGVLIGAGRCAVDEDGEVVPPSKMTVQQLRAELMARGLSVDGLRRDLYKRIQAARKAMAPDVIKQQQKAADKRRARLEENERAAPQRKRRLRQRVVRQERWVNGRLVEVSDVVVDEEPDPAMDEEEGEGEADEEGEPARLPRRVVAGDDDLDPEEEEEDEDDPFAVDRLRSGEDEAAEQMIDRNMATDKTEAGALTGIHLLHLFEKLGGHATPADFKELILAAEVGKSAAAAREAGLRWARLAPSLAGPEGRAVYDMFHRLQQRLAQPWGSLAEYARYAPLVAQVHPWHDWYRVQAVATRTCIAEGETEWAAELLEAVEHGGYSLDAQLLALQRQVARVLAGPPPAEQRQPEPDSYAEVVHDQDAEEVEQEDEE